MHPFEELVHELHGYDLSESLRGWEVAAAESYFSDR